MSKISIAVAEPCHNINAVKLIREVTGIALISIEKKLATGKAGSFYIAELFLNDHVEIDRNIRLLINGLEKLGLPIFVAEIAYDESWGNIANLDDVRISADDLIAELDNAKGQFS
ncbi:hypothetical protein ACO0LD_20595 [Undibacterium sp. Ji83W]|uniref:hypothetical protein n=1 Tax=Undibacterium sp. Ji83W TaxID=3413043 RepID=UPI003BEFBF0D